MTDRELKELKGAVKKVPCKAGNQSLHGIGGLDYCRKFQPFLSI